MDVCARVCAVWVLIVSIVDPGYVEFDVAWVFKRRISHWTRTIRADVVEHHDAAERASDGDERVGASFVRQYLRRAPRGVENARMHAERWMCAADCAHIGAHHARRAARIAFIRLHRRVLRFLSRGALCRRRGGGTNSGVNSVDVNSILARVSCV